MKSLLARFVVVIALTALLLGMVLGAEYRSFLNRPLVLPPEGIDLIIKSGSSYMSMVRQLNQRRISSTSWHWRLLQKLEPRLIRAGEYHLEPGLLPRTWLDKLAAGDVIVHHFTIIEGWTFRQLRDALAAEPLLEATFADLSDEELMSVLGHPEQNPEGRFLPETYQFTRGDSDRELLERSWEAMESALADAWQTRREALPLDSPFELLILASIIEKETGLADERARIGGVFIRRLEKGMKLQTDPTVIYGLGASFDGDLRYRDLATDTPYNTYTRHGLPPGPIALAGKAALRAAANPAQGEELYFVAVGDGSHHFSKTNEEHNRAVNRYQRKK